VVSIRDREKLKVTADPWNGRTLEWATASPPPPWNFAVLPQVTDIEMPRNSATGFVCAFFATFAGFSLIWHIWWLAILAGVGAYATFVVFAWRDRTEEAIPADVVARIDRANRAARSAALAA
jgi:cytochrome o ubiquinol oxidase subunit 1